jgi:hypothetical protein
MPWLYLITDCLSSRIFEPCLLSADEAGTQKRGLRLCILLGFCTKLSAWQLIACANSERRRLKSTPGAMGERWRSGGSSISNARTVSGRRVGSKARMRQVGISRVDGRQSCLTTSERQHHRNTGHPLSTSCVQAEDARRTEGEPCVVIMVPDNEVSRSPGMTSNVNQKRRKSPTVNLSCP